MIDTWVGVSKSGRTKRMYVLVEPDGWIHSSVMGSSEQMCWWNAIRTHKRTKKQMQGMGYTVQRCEIRLKGGAS